MFSGVNSRHEEDQRLSADQLTIMNLSRPVALDTKQNLTGAITL